MLTNHIKVPFKVYAASLLALLRPLIIQVGVKSEEKKKIKFPTCSALTPQRASQSAFLLTSLHRDLARQSLPCSTIPLSLLPALMMSHTIWFSAVSSRKRDLVSGEEKERKGGVLERGAGRTQKTKDSLFPLCAL